MDLTQTKQKHKLPELLSLIFPPETVRSYHDDDEVQPAPGVGEVFDEAQSQPLDDHLHGEDHSKDSVHVVEHVLQDRPLRQVNVLGSLKQGRG